MIAITPSEIDVFSKYVFDISGIQLDQSKGYLLESRLSNLVVSTGVNSYMELYRAAIADQSQSIKNKIIDAITTNETYFFRDIKPFDLLKNKIIPDLIDRKRRENPSRKIPIRIWCAACSTGQEVFSIGMTLLEMSLGRDQYDINILGTDISDDAIARASYGKYNPFELDRGLPKYYLNKYFARSADGWRIKDEVRTLARFEKKDLNQSFSDLGRFDIVFCRNVAIYFSHDNKIRLFNKIAHVLSSGGSLIVGASESLSGIANAYEPQYYLKTLFYQLKSDNGAPARTAGSHQKPAEPARIPVARQRQPAAPSINQPLRRQPVPPPPVQKPTVKPAIQPAPKAAATPPAVPPISVTPAGHDRGSLLSSIQGKKQLGSSLLSKVGKKDDISKKTLLQKVRKKPEKKSGEK